jgi:hypothetical protein
MKSRARSSGEISGYQEPDGQREEKNKASKGPERSDIRPLLDFTGLRFCREQARGDAPIVTALKNHKAGAFPVPQPGVSSGENLTEGLS